MLAELNPGGQHDSCGYDMMPRESPFKRMEVGRNDMSEDERTCTDYGTSNPPRLGIWILVESSFCLSKALFIVAIDSFQATASTPFKMRPSSVTPPPLFYFFLHCHCQSSNALAKWMTETSGNT